jgi:hypothetical protein
MHNQSDVSFQATINIEVNKIINESDAPARKKYTQTSKSTSLAAAGETPLVRNSREQALTGGSRPSSHYFPSATISTKD